MTMLQIYAYQSSDGKLWFADCPELPELKIGAPTFAELCEWIEDVFKETLLSLPVDRLEAVMAGPLGEPIRLERAESKST